MKRRLFVQKAGLLSGGLLFSRSITKASPQAFPVVRTAAAQRHFNSPAIEAAITEFKANVKIPNWVG